MLEACAFGIKDPVSGEAVAAAVQLCDGSELSAPALITWMRERIRPDAVPARIFTIDEIPKTDRGKLNRDIVARFCTGETSA